MRKKAKNRLSGVKIELGKMLYLGDSGALNREEKTGLKLFVRGKSNPIKQKTRARASMM